MKVAIMQPYFLPYIGYFQLINAVDVFVVYDNIEYTKKGWINRNRFLLNNKGIYFTIPLRSGSDFLTVKERFISESFNRKKLLSQVYNSYKKAPYFDETYPILEQVVSHNNLNLFDYIYHSIVLISSYLDIKTKIRISSNIEINPALKSTQKVLATCKVLHATTYINPIGGVELYSKVEFKQNGIELVFIKSNNFLYKQFKHEFIPWLSILDVLMFNSIEEIKRIINFEYTLL